MTDANPDANILPQLRQPKLNPLILAILILLVAVVGGALVLRFTTMQEAREIMQWQNKLNLIADSRAADMDAWLDHHFTELSTVAANPSLQLYVSALLGNASPDATKPVVGEAPPEAAYLRPLLSITADRMGFVEKPSEELKSINADVQPASGVGLAILDNDGKFLVSTGGLTELPQDIAKKVMEAPKNQSALINFYTAASGQTRIGFIVPIYPIQGAADTTQQIGRLVAIKDIDNGFFKLMQHPGATEQSLEAVLLQKEDGDVIVYAPTDTGKLAAISFALNTPRLDAAYAVTEPGSFAEKMDRLSHETLMTSRPIAHTPWVLMEHIDRDQALAEGNLWRQEMQVAMLFALLAMIGGLVAVWYYGTSQRTLLLSIETGRLASRLAAQEKLLRVVADNQLEPILIVDQQNVAHFANEKAGRAFQMPSGSIVGKDLPALMGSARAAEYIAANQSALTSGKPFFRTWRTGNNAEADVIQSEHIPLSHIPIDRLPTPSRGVLIIDQNVSKVVHERERRLRTLNQLVNVLLYLVDKRDPHAAHHSMGVALVAREISGEMQLDTVLADTTETAGKLMNIGKIAVPSQLLIKQAALAEEELRLIRESLQASVMLLRDIEFEGPVVDTLRQMQERYDGAGPLRLKGDDILITARIITTANAFVGMISPRSYRAAMSSDQAIANLMQNADAQFDRRAVVALANFITNKRGKEALAVIMKPPANT